MSKQTIKGHLYWQMNQYMKTPEFVFEKYDMRTWSEDSKDGRVWVKECEFEVDVPDNFDPRPSMVAGLKQEKERVHKEFAARVAEIDQRINKLLALEMA